MEDYKKYCDGINANEEVHNWVDTVLANYLKTHKGDSTDIEHILDYLVSSAAPKRLRKMSYTEAKSNAAKWSVAQQKKGRGMVDTIDDIETVHDFLDGNKIVRLKTKKAYQREGFMMHHCSGSYEPSDTTTIYSYRDKNNNPHATFEVRSDGEINQIKGKGNGPIHPKYINTILVFLDVIGQKIRPSDMKNLGYLHIPKNALHLVKMIDGYENQIHVLKGEAYAFKTP